MNWIILTSAIIPTLGIVVTIYQVFLVERRRLYSNTDGIYAINSPNRLQNVSIVVRHNGAEYPDNIYIYKAFFKNLGNRDISARDFQNPLRITLPSTVTMIDHQIDDRHNAKVTTNTDGNSLNLKWGILKPREKIDVSILFSSEDEIQFEEFEKSVDLDDRLINVSPSKPTRVGQYAIAGAMSVFILLLFGSLFLFGGTGLLKQQEFSVAYPAASGNLVVVGLARNKSFTACKLFESPVVVQDCQSLEASEASKFLENNPPSKGYVGQRISTLSLIIGTTLIYTLAPFIALIRRDRKRKGRKRLNLHKYDSRED